MEASFAEPVNVENPFEITILDLAKKIRKLAGSKSPIQFCPLPEDDPKKRKPDITRVRVVLGWEPVVFLEEGLRQTAQWFADRHVA